MSRLLVTVVLVFSLVLSGACDRDGEEPETAAADGPPFTYVAIGASESVGVGASRPRVEAWTNVLYRTALRRSATFVNLGVSGSTVRQALEGQVPAALQAEPSLVTVWLNVNDLVRLVPVADYERDLGELVHRLRRNGETQVLVANTPPIEELPVVRACMPSPPAGVRCPLPIRLPGPEPVVSLVSEYNAAIERVVAREGAVLVDLHAAGLKAVDEGRHASYVAADGFHPSTAGHAAVAAVFGEVLRSTASTRALATRTSR